MFLSVVMPAYNEAASIEDVVLDHIRVLGQMSPAFEHWEIVCVDDGSKDGTGKVLDRIAASDPRVRVVHQANQGIFGAFSRGFQEARGTYIYMTGSDGQWPPENLQKLLAQVQAGADLVVGVRTNRREVYSASRRLVSLAFNLLPRILFGVRVEDAGSVKLGLRELFVMELISRSPFFEAERLIRAARGGHRVEFVPIEFLNRTGGKARGASWKNIRGSALDLIRCLATLGFR